MSLSEAFASARHSCHTGTCRQQIEPGDGQRDKSCVSKGILSVTYSNKQIHTRSFLYLPFGAFL